MQSRHSITYLELICILNTCVHELFTKVASLNMSCLFIMLSGVTDLKDVIEYVFELNVSQFTQLGLQLGLLLPTLEKIADCTKPGDYGTKVMTEWLRQVDNAKPTWNNLAKALDKRTVKGHVQANQIREDLKST